MCSRSFFLRCFDSVLRREVNVRGKKEVGRKSHRGGDRVVLVAGGRLPARGGVVVVGGGLYGRGVE